MSAEPIARVVAEIRSGLARRVPQSKDIDTELDVRMQAYAQSVAALAGPVVDVTSIYRSLSEHPRPVDVYEDHPCISPPWPAATFAYANEHGNVVVVTSMAVDYRNGNAGDAEYGWKGWATDNEVDWDAVRWVLDSFVWLGGRTGDGAHIRTAGPWALWRYAIHEDGTPADLHWMQLCDYEVSHWDMASLSVLGALNFCNCRNVELVEPHRPRAEARRIARTGMRVHTINVFPTGKSVRTAKAEGSMGAPLTSVRGHFACYGPEHGRGLLFGKHAGRFWIPQHARGDASHGESHADYRLVTESADA